MYVDRTIQSSTDFFSIRRFNSYWSYYGRVVRAGLFILFRQRYLTVDGNVDVLIVYIKEKLTVPDPCCGKTWQAHLHKAPVEV